jgi:hypothetical protein
MFPFGHRRRESSRLLDADGKAVRDCYQRAQPTSKTRWQRYRHPYAQTQSMGQHLGKRCGVARFIVSECPDRFFSLRLFPLASANNTMR